MAECNHPDEPGNGSKNADMDGKQFKCSICMENYINPRYLPTCGHTFCENCLLKYIRNIQQESQGSTFACPVCRKSNSLPGHDDVTLQWVQTYPLNTVIIKLMESLPQSKDQVVEERKICDACKEEGEITPGFKFCLDCKEMLCKICTKYHKKVKVSKDHKLIDAIGMPIETWRTDFLTNVGKCAGHPEREIEIYCKSHDVLICSLCSTFQHTACDMTEVADHNIDVIKLKKDSALLIAHMKATVEHLKLLKKSRVEVKNSFQKKLKEIRETIEHVRDEVVELMENVVSHVSDVTKQIAIEREDAVDIELSNTSKIEELTEQNAALLHTIGLHGSEKQKFVSVHTMKKQFEKTITQISEEAKQMKQFDAMLILVDNLKKLTQIRNVEELVEVKVTENENSHASLDSVLTNLENTVAKRNFLKDSKLIKAEEHSVWDGDGLLPWLTGVTTCKDGRLIVCDYTGWGQIYVYNPADRSALKLKLIHDPFSAAVLDDKHIAVSMPDNNTISIVTVGKELRVEKTFMTPRNPGSIVALKNNQLAIAWDKPSAFGVLDVTETDIVSKSYFDQDTSGRKFKSFYDLAVDEERQHVIQPCPDDKAVYCFNMTGQPVFTYTHTGLKEPRGVAVDKCGNIYVCACTNPGSIHKLSPTGEPISVITEDIPALPRSIGTDVNGTGLWVTRNSAPPDKILYFHLKEAKKPKP